METTIEAKPIFNGRHLPQTIAALVAQLGGVNLSGAFVCTGADRTKAVYVHPEGRDDEEVRGDEGMFEAGGPVFTVGVAFPVNGARKEGWMMAVNYAGNDTYTVWLWRQTAGQPAEMLQRDVGIYGENLTNAVLDIYDAAINEYNGGFIPLDDDE